MIENVVTDPDHRKRGHGKAILDAASERAWAHRCYKIMLSTGSKRPETLAFYESAGFSQSRTGFQKRNLPSRTETAG
ncbi:GNAT family N-acetyltransferase [Yoonia sp. 2307UL14-13]|uniref:GNAT family N-acetyltransferase n=1 Tax=Yoonia sp. 2307UL14-13 TaxID=3126506 RepID=UPI00404012AB